MREKATRLLVYFIIMILVVSLFSGCSFFNKSEESPGIANLESAGNGNSGDLTVASNLSENLLEIKLQIGSDLMTINGRSSFMDVVPVIKNEITLVPIKFITEAFNISAFWMPETQQVRIVDGSKAFFLTINSSVVNIGTEVYSLASPPEIIGGRTFVPLRFVSEALGAKVEWDGETRGITITR